ncbi:hypothetical protein BU15DRAFT_61119 [Melanogaster broomeanus]|nr:hypothetical protein BU15DRAFT_61119 [Melanogaster broomeanus]
MSVIRKHYVIGRVIRFVGCVLLDHCVIPDGWSYQYRANLESSILGRSTTVGGKAELVQSVTQGGYEVKGNGGILALPYVLPLPLTTSYSENYRNEKLDSDWGAETEDQNLGNSEYGEDSEEQSSNEEDG